jgi:hypothetical protein
MRLAAILAAMALGTMQGIGDFLYLLAWGVCPPSGRAWACAT